MLLVTACTGNTIVPEESAPPGTTSTTTTTTLPTTTTPTTSTTTTAPPTPTTTTTSTALPGGVVTIPNGADIQSYVDDHPTGTTFSLSGRYERQTVVPKSGNTFVGPAVLDGRDATGYAFRSAASDVTIRGIEVTGYTSGKQYAPIMNFLGGGSPSGDRWTVEDCDVHDNLYAGIYLVGENPIIRDCQIHHNRQIGVKVTDSSGGLISGSDIYSNNQFDEHSSGWEAGGSKFVRTQGLVLRNNTWRDNHGPGIWFDNENDRAVIEGNQVLDNHGIGIFWEISFQATISNNTVRGCGSRGRQWLYDAGIVISSSGSSQESYIQNNNVSSCRDGITLIQQNRGSNVTKNWTVSDNRVTDLNDNSGGHHANAVGGASDTTTIELYSTTTWDRNTYDSTVRYHWNGKSGDFAWWQSFGHDLNGTNAG